MTRSDVRRLALHAELLASDSATAVLERRFGGPIEIRRTAADMADTGCTVTALLQARGDEAVTRRQVRLQCGKRAISSATSWYVAARLPAAMAHDLTATTRPFGHIIRCLGLRRATVFARVCAAGEAHALEHRALLADSDGRPMALADENYG